MQVIKVSGSGHGFAKEVDKLWMLAFCIVLSSQVFSQFEPKSNDLQPCRLAAACKACTLCCSEYRMKGGLGNLLSSCDQHGQTNR